MRKRDFGTSVVGYTAADGNRWIGIKQHGEIGLAPLSQFTSATSNVAFDRIGRQGIVIAGPVHKSNLLSQIQELADYDLCDIIERPGLNDGVFSRPDGRVLFPSTAMPADGDTWAVAFVKECGHEPTRGTNEGWREHVGGLIAGQHLLSFACLLALLPLARALMPGRKYNTGFCFEGVSRTQAETIHTVAASVNGGIYASKDELNWPSAHQLVGRVTELGIYQHRLVQLGGTDYYLSSHDEKKGRASMRQLVFNLVSGEGIDDCSANPMRRLTLSFMLAGQKPLIDRLGLDQAACDELAGCLISIPLPEGRPLGLFDHLPETYDDVVALSRAIEDGARAHHGVTLERFQEIIVEKLATAPDRIYRLLDDGRRRFLRNHRVEMSSATGVPRQIAEAFADVAAAGWLASQLRALPSGIEVFQTVIECYRLHIGATASSVPIQARVRAIAADPHVITIGSAAHAALDEFELETTAAFLKHGSRGAELIIPTRHLAALVPDAETFLTEAEAEKLLRVDKDQHKARMRQMGPNYRERAYVLRVAP
jgi:hypothetical protein